jgi:PAS domain S-box-containing protein
LFLKTPVHNNIYPFLLGGGEMGELIRNFNWSSTPIGDPVTWPQSLHISLANVLNSGFPMFLFWGKELTCFYNDAFRPSLGVEGKHPAIGKAGKEVWSEIWDFIGPLIESVINTGKPVWFKDQLVPFYRNGKLEDIYWTFSYSLVFNDDHTAGGVLVTCMETTEAVVGLKQVSESEQRFRTLADSVPMMVFMIEPNKNINVNYWNETWLTYTGQTFEQAIGRAWDGIVHPDDVPGVIDIFIPAIEKRESYVIPAIRLKRADGQYRWHMFKGNPRYLADGEFMGYVGVGIDIHDQKMTEEKLEELVNQRTEELQRSNEELKRSNQNLEEFAHAASHDLKEPVRKILFYTAQLKERFISTLNVPTLKAFDRIETATLRMRMLIDDLLVYSHVSVKPHEKEIVDLNQKLQRVLEDLELDIEEKNAFIEVHHLPVVKGFRRQLQQLFQNLVSNALKYSKKDIAPHLIIHASETTKDHERYHVISITDNGIGFDEKYAGQIFEIFSRLHSKSEYAGTGVGLSIVKKVVANHDGFIEVESKPGVGSTFTIYLPQ